MAGIRAPYHDRGLRTVSGPSGTISSTAGTSHRSCPPLNGPFRGRFAIRNSLCLSAREIFFGPDGVVPRDTTAGTAGRWERILVDVS